MHAEFKAHEKWGLALIGGAGMTSTKSAIVGEQHFMAWEVGGQFRYYLLGDFDHGLQVGGEVLYVDVYDEAADSYTGNASRVRKAMGVAPFAGYKVATKLGFTFDAQLGIQRRFILAEAHQTASGSSVSDDDNAWRPILNLRVGWSF